MKRIIAALFLAGFAGSSFAVSANDIGGSYVASPQDCPAGTTSTHASYKWQSGRFVRDGWFCQRIYQQ